MDIFEFYDAVKNESGLPFSRVKEMFLGKFKTIADLNQAYRDYGHVAYGIRRYAQSYGIDVPSLVPYGYQPYQPEELDQHDLTCHVTHYVLHLRKMYKEIVGEIAIRNFIEVAEVPNTKLPPGNPAC